MLLFLQGKGACAVEEQSCSRSSWQTHQEGISFVCSSIGASMLAGLLLVSSCSGGLGRVELWKESLVGWAAWYGAVAAVGLVELWRRRGVVVVSLTKM